MNDAWQQAYGAANLNSDDDFDHDGASNRYESIAGTDPLDGADRLYLNPPVRIEQGVLVRWQSVPGKRYLVEWMVDGDWVICDDGLIGTGEMLTSALSAHGIEGRLIRVRLDEEITEAAAAIIETDSKDSDNDGQGDIFEYHAGTNPIDANSKFEIDSLTYDNAVCMRWNSVLGKYYQLETSSDLNASTWVPLASKVLGTGQSIEIDCPLPAENTSFFRIRVSDNDQDNDGYTDWTEAVMGTDPARPETSLPSLPQKGPVIRIELAAASAVVNRGETATFRVVRDGLLPPLQVHLQAGGTAISEQDYEPLPTIVLMKAGQRSLEIPVRSKLTTLPIEGRSVTLNILPNDAYQIGPQSQWDVHLISEHRISVKDYGAKGDGTTDDSAAIQNALTALEQSSSANTLWFPAGRYRLATLTPQSWTPGSYHCSVQLSGGPASSRDLIFAGEPGSVLYAEPGNVRSQIMVIPARYRSYSFRGLTWEKSPQPRLMPSAGVEPNWSDGVSVVNKPGSSVAEVGFVQCTFVNCHSSVRTYSSGTDPWGGLGVFRMTGCKVLNPYGSNVMITPHPYGGGQQVNLTPWVRYACYDGNEFNGSSDGAIDESLNPGRVPKDGSHFGSPMELRFVNNTVRNMGVEAVFKTQDISFNSTASPFTIPPPGQGTAEVILQPWAMSTALPGNHYIFRAPLEGRSVNIVLTAVSHDRSSNTMVIRNEMTNPISYVGMTVPMRTPIYWQEAHSEISTISGNVIIDGRAEAIGIVSNSRVYCMNNIVQGYGTGLGIFQSPQNPNVSAGNSSRFHNNYISLAQEEVSWTRSGLYLEAPYISATQNVIMVKNALQTIGIRMERGGILAANNRLISTSSVRYGYQNAQRSVGIGVGPYATDTLIRKNCTSGFDLGVGQSQPNQTVVPFTVGPHKSDNDTIDIDPKGAIREPSS
jgi:hypothetical protein